MLRSIRAGDGRGVAVGKTLRGPVAEVAGDGSPAPGDAGAGAGGLFRVPPPEARGAGGTYLGGAVPGGGTSVVSEGRPHRLQNPHAPPRSAPHQGQWAER